jgi:hypothetical protein
MPEGPEVETEKLHEAIHEELEKEGGRLLRTIALTAALLAALARNRLVWFGSLALGTAGLVVLATALLA